MKFIVGLGNPGRGFSHSRHNVGYRCVDYMARRWGITLAERRAKVVLGQGHVGRFSVVLSKPRTFMNKSGEGVAYLLTRFASTPADLLIIYDDMDLPLGTVRIRPRGGAAGHNGIKSIVAALGTEEFPRLRVGIGKPPDGQEGMDYVLGSFSPHEEPVVRDAVMRVAEAVDHLLEEGIQAAMNSANRAPEPPAPGPAE